MAPPGTVIRYQQFGRKQTVRTSAPDSRLLLFFLLDRFADDVGDVGIAFFLFLDEGGVVHALVHLDFFFACGSRSVGGLWLLALLLGLCVLERNEFGVRRFRRD